MTPRSYKKVTWWHREKIKSDVWHSINYLDPCEAFCMYKVSGINLHWWGKHVENCILLSTCRNIPHLCPSSCYKDISCCFVLIPCRIIGLYVSLVLVIGQFVRVAFLGSMSRIMFDELPHVDRIFKLCLSIYLVRESREWELEEELFSKLIFLYRSPETLILWTKPKQSWSLRCSSTEG